MKSQVLALAILLGLSGVSSISSATAMSAERSRCFGMETIAQNHKKWSIAFSKFQLDFPSLTTTQKFQVTTKGTERILQHIEELSDRAGVAVDLNLIDETYLDLSNAALGDVPKRTAIRTLKEKMILLQDEMSDVLFRAQSKNPNCNLGVLNSPPIILNSRDNSRGRN